MTIHTRGHPVLWLDYLQKKFEISSISKNNLTTKTIQQISLNNPSNNISFEFLRFKKTWIFFGNVYFSWPNSVKSWHLWESLSFFNDSPSCFSWLFISTGTLHENIVWLCAKYAVDANLFWPELRSSLCLGATKNGFLRANKKYNMLYSK